MTDTAIPEGAIVPTDEEIEADNAIPSASDEIANYAIAPDRAEIDNFTKYGTHAVPDGADLRLPEPSQWKDQALNTLWKDAKTRSMDEEEEILHIANISKTPAEVVRTNIDAFRESIETAKFGLPEMRTKHPDLYRILGTNPELSHGINKAVTEDLSWLTRTLRIAQVKDDMRDKWAQAAGLEGYDRFKAEMVLAAEQAFGSNDVDEATWLPGHYDAPGSMAETRAALVAESFRMEEEALVAEAGTPREMMARVSRQADKPSSLPKSYKVMGERIDATAKRFDAANARSDLAFGVIFGASPERIKDLKAHAEVLKEESAIINYYGDEGVLGNLNEAIAAAQSSAGGIAKGLAYGSATLAASTAAGTLVGNPMTGFTVGARAFPFVYGIASGTHSFQQEFGGFLMQADDTLTEDGRKIEERDKIATAAVYATLATSVELMSEFMIGLPALGAVGKLVATGNAKMFLTAVAKTPALQAVVKGVAARLPKRVAATAAAGKAVGITALKMAAAEGGEEGIQESLSEIGMYVRKSMTDERWNDPKVFESLSTIAHSISVGAQGGLLIGASARSAGLSAEATIRALTGGKRAAIAEEAQRTRDKIKESMLGTERIMSIINASREGVGKASPATLTRIIEENTAPGSKTEIFVAVEAIEKEAAARGVSPEILIDTLDGRSARDDFINATDSGAKYSVPVESYIRNWVTSGVADSVLKDTTDRTNSFSINDAQEIANSVELKELEIEAIEAELSGGVAEITDEAQDIDPVAGKTVAAGEIFEEGLKDVASGSEEIAVAAGDIATINRAFIHATSDSMGVDAAELYADTAMEIKDAEEAAIQDGESTAEGGATVPGEASGEKGGVSDRGGVQPAGEGVRDAKSPDGVVVEAEQGIEAVKSVVKDEVASKVAGQKKAKKKSTKKKSTKKKATKKKSKKKKEPALPAKRKVTGPHNKPWKSVYSAWEELLESIGGTDQSPSSYEDDLYRKHELTEAIRSKRAKSALKAKRAAEKAGEPVPSQTRGRVAVTRPKAWEGGEFDELNKQLEGGHKGKVKFKRVSGAYEAFHRMVGNDTTWDSQSVAEAVTALRVSNGFENLHIPDDAMASMDEEQFVKEQAEERGLDPETFEVLKQEVDGRVLGFIKILRDGTDKAFKIFLTKHANVATMLHEQAHAYLEMLGSMAKGLTPSGKEISNLRPEQAARDMEKILEYLGAESHTNLTEKQKELWARSFEKYIIEGKSPSSKLDAAFQRLRIILLEIYRSLRTLDDVELTDDIRGVFDRMLATDKEIASSRARLGLIDKRHDKTTRGVADKVSAELYEHRQEALSDLAGRRMASAKAKARAEYRSLPAVKADKYIKREGINTGFKAVADVFGFGTTKAMNKAIASVGEESAYVEQRGQEIAKERHPEMFDEIMTLEKATMNALHHAEKVNDLFIQQAEINKRARLTKRPDKKGLQRRAVEIVGGMKAQRLSLEDAVRLERTAAERKTKAIAKGDFKLAAEMITKQILAHYMWKEVRRARGIRETFYKTALRMLREASRQRLGKADPAYRDVVDQMLESLGLRPKIITDPTVERATPRILEGVMLESGHDAVFDTDSLSVMIYGEQRSWSEMTVSELEKITGILKNISKGASAALTAKIDDKVELVSMIREELIKEAFNMPDLGPEKGGNSSAKLIQAGLHNMASADAAFLKARTIIDMLGGGSTGSMWMQAVFLPLQKASNLESDLTEKYLTPLFDDQKSMPAETQKSWTNEFNGRLAFPDHVDDLVPTQRYEIVMMALGLGTHSSTQRMSEGRNITIEQMMDAIKILTKAELLWVQKAWDTLDSLWETTANIYERDKGTRPHKLTKSSFIVETSDGHTVVMRGGYFPAIYDSRVSHVGADLRSVIESEMMMNSGRPSVNQDHLKSREDKVVDVLSLDPDIIQQGLARAIHYIAFREPVKAVQNIMFNRDVFTAMRRTIGKERADVMKQWLRDVGGAGVISLDPNVAPMEQFLRRRKNAFTVAILGHSIRIAIPDVINIPIASLTTDLKAKYALAGTRALVTSPKKARAFALENSGILRRLEKQIDQEFREELARMKQDKTVARSMYNWARDTAFAPMQFINNGVATSIWLGAYQQISDQGGNHERAVAFADSTTSLSVPSFSTIDQPGLARSKGALGHLSTFWGYFSVLYSQYRKIWHPTHTATPGIETNKAAMKAIGMTLALTALSWHMTSLVMGKGPEPGESWPRWFARGLVSGVLSPLPFGVSYVSDSLILGRPHAGVRSPGMAFADEYVKFFKQLSKKNISIPRASAQAARAAAVTFGFPLGSAHGIEYLFNAADSTSNVELSNPGDLIGGLIYRKRDSHIFNLFDPSNSR